MENHIEVEEKQDKGFTLVELLIVIVILGILATVTVFAVRGITDQGKTSTCKADSKTLQTAYEAYVAQYGGTTIPVRVPPCRPATDATPRSRPSAPTPRGHWSMPASCVARIRQLDPERRRRSDHPGRRRTRRPACKPQRLHRSNDLIQLRIKFDRSRAFGPGFCRFAINPAPCLATFASTDCKDEVNGRQQGVVDHRCQPWHGCGLHEGCTGGWRCRGRDRSSSRRGVEGCR